MDDTPKLWERMRALAAKGHARAAELREHADALEKATAGFFADNQTVTVQKFMGAWARARKLWCEITGESLV